MPEAGAAAPRQGLPPSAPSAAPGRGRQTFEDSMVHEVLCVTRRFTACCALHRCLSRGVLHDDVSGSRLGAGTPRRLSARLSVSRRRNATRRLPRSSGLTPLLLLLRSAREPCGERRLPIALPLGAHTRPRPPPRAHRAPGHGGMRSPPLLRPRGTRAPAAPGRRPGVRLVRPPCSLSLSQSFRMCSLAPPAGVTRWRPGADDDAPLLGWRARVPPGAPTPPLKRGHGA